jgi:signal peptidase II
MIHTFVRFAWFLLLGMVLLFLDFITKAYVYHVMPFYDSCIGASCVDYMIFKQWFGIDLSITLTQNTGAAWGFFSNFQVLLMVVRVALIGGMFFYLFFINKQSSQILPLVLVLAGALGNVVDFFLYGFVVDFLHFNLWGYDFPVFNFADTYITIGVFWLAFVSAVRKQKKYA